MKHAKFNEKFIRKHNSTFTESELSVLQAKIETCDPENLTLSTHFYDRLTDYNVTSPISDVVAAIHRGKIIDYSRDRRNRPIDRFLLRDMTDDHIHVVIVVQCAYGKWTALTAWENQPDDMHETLDMSLYTEFDIHQCDDRPKHLRLRR